tara:strand:+ start:11198 stop:11929 length:732 start_codon:yes stop_codon:yes gene_type:complete
MSEQYLIKKTTALYPRVDKTYRYDSEQQRSIPCGSLDDGAEYSLSFVMDELTAQSLWSYMKTTYAEEKKKTWPEIKNPFKKTEQGMFTYKATLKGAYNNDKTKKPSQYDAKTNELPNDFQLTTNSIVNIAVKGIPYSGSMGTGCSLRLQAVQVLQLAERKQESPFGTEEGYDSKEGNPFVESAVAAVNGLELVADVAVVPTEESIEEPTEEPIEEPTKLVKKTASAPPADDSDLSSIIDDWDD